MAGERDIKFISLFENRGHQGPYSPYKPFNVMAGVLVLFLYGIGSLRVIDIIRVIIWMWMQIRWKKTNTKVLNKSVFFLCNLQQIFCMKTALRDIRVVRQTENILWWSNQELQQGWSYTSSHQSKKETPTQAAKSLTLIFDQTSI